MNLTKKNVIRFPALKEKIGLSRSTVFRMEKAKSFPQHIRMGANSVGWLEHEVDAWIESRVQGGTHDE